RFSRDWSSDVCSSDLDLPAAGSWPHPFTAILTVIFAAELTVALEVHNTGQAELTYEEALHTYFAVEDVRAIAVQGLDGAGYLDKIGRASWRDSVTMLD